MLTVSKGAPNDGGMAVAVRSGHLLKFEFCRPRERAYPEAQLVERERQSVDSCSSLQETVVPGAHTVHPQFK